MSQWIRITLSEKPPDPDGAKSVVVLLERTGRGTCGVDPESDQHVQIAQHQSAYVFDGCVAASEPASDESGRGINAEDLEGEIR